MSLPAVTDHAVIRWLERVHGVDMDYFRNQIAQKCKGLKACRGITVDGFTYVLKDGVVITVTPAHTKPIHRVPRYRHQDESAEA